MPRKKKTDEAHPTDSAVKPPKAKRKTDTFSEKLIVQYGGAEWSVDALKEKAIAAYVAEGHRRGRISTFVMYVKPEERKAYYVINDKNAGSVDCE